MKKYIKLFIIITSITILIILLILSNINKDELKESDITLLNDLITVETINYNSEEITISMENKTNDDYTYGSNYYLEEKKDGKWYILKPKEEMFFTSIAYELKSNNKVEETINFSYHYGILNKGIYRIIKSLYNNNDIPVGPDDDKYIMAEFEIK